MAACFAENAACPEFWLCIKWLSFAVAESQNMLLCSIGQDAFSVLLECPVQTHL